MPPGKKKRQEVIYTIQVEARVVKELQRIPALDQERILCAIDALATEPKPHGSKKLVNQPGWRIRIGDYRVLYEILENEKIIRVFKAGHRRQIYR